MSHPRPEQVAELTRGHSIPFDPLPEENLMIIAEALWKAWDDLLLDQSQTLLVGGEAEVNALMESRLNALLDEDSSAWALLVTRVARGKETISFDGSHLEKRPDLSVYVTDRKRRSFPLIVECKLLHATLGKGVGMYCNDGLARFPRGDYAWATREAIMLAYVRDGSAIPSHLVPFLSRRREQTPDSFATTELPGLVQHPNLHLARSRHLRQFAYVVPSSSAPGPIAIWHLWLYGKAKA